MTTMSTDPIAEAPISKESLGLLLAVVIPLLLLCATTKKEVTLAGNESSRLAPVQMLVEHGTFAIEGSMFETVDKVKIGGHFYTNKPPLLICWLGAIYWVLHHGFTLSFANSYHLVIYLLTILGIGSFSVLLAGRCCSSNSREPASPSVGVCC